MQNSSPPVLEILEGYKKIVWPEIKSYLKDPIYPTPFLTPKKYEKEVEHHWQIVKEYPERKGKYLRPTLLILTAEAMGTNYKKALKTAAAMQISEDWLLIHDDFEDNSMERRGKPTLHRLFGNELAVNAGDALHMVMWKILSDNLQILGSHKTYLLQEEFYRILARTALGQGVEIKWAEDNKIDFDDTDWFFIGDGKTSYYTIAGPMRLGAIIAGANKKQLEALAKFGTYLGRCFQIVDDLLDLTSDFSGLKKQTGNDIYEGKRTVMLGHLLASVNSKDKRKLLSILKKDRAGKSEDEIEWVIEKMHQYGSITHARNLAQALKEKAQLVFERDLKFLAKEPARNYLSKIITFILERQS